MDKDTKQHVNISGGPLAYRYQFEEIYIHYGTENSRGSEHFIQGYSFPGEVSRLVKCPKVWPEFVQCLLVQLFLYLLCFSFASPQIQIYGFNKELYHNMSEAQHKSQGIVGLSLMVQIGETPNPELRIITSTFNKVLYRGEYTSINEPAVSGWPEINRRKT